MGTSWKTKINTYISKTHFFFLCLFALGIFTSVKLTSNCLDFIYPLGLIQMVLLGENPFKKIKDKKLNSAIIFFILAMLISFLGHPYPKVFSLFKGHLTILLFFYIIVLNLKNIKQVKILIIIASVSMFIAALMGTYQHYILKLPRIKGFLFELTFGCYLAIFILFLIAYGVWGKTKVAYRLATIPGIALLGLNLLFTQARGAWLGFLGGAFMLAWLKDKKIIAPLLIICLLLYFFLPQTYIDRFQSIFDTKTNDSNLTRIAIWKSALSMYRDHFISGVGLGRFRVEYHQNYKQSYPVEWRHRHAHNNLLQYMAESGTFGLIAFLWLMVAIILWLYQNHLQITDPNWRLFLLASLCSVIIFNIQGLTDVNYGGHRYEDARRFFWFFMALNIAIANIYRKDPKPNEELTLNSN